MEWILLDLTKTLAILGASEGTWYSAPGVSVDVRYKASFADVKGGSALSFGVCQFDMSTNPSGRVAFKTMLMQAVATGTLNDATSTRIYLNAQSKHAKILLTQSDLSVVNSILLNSKATIDVLDGMWARSMCSLLISMINGAATYWSPKMSPPKRWPVLSFGTKECLILCAYFIASLNRTMSNQGPFQSWLVGKNFQMFDGRPGVKLKSPPAVEDIYSFISSLRMWQPWQGNFQNLRRRLDPLLAFYNVTNNN